MVNNKTVKIMLQPKYTKDKFEDFQKSEMFMDFAIEGDFKTEIIATVKDGNLIILKADTKQIKK